MKETFNVSQVRNCQGKREQTMEKDAEEFKARGEIKIKAISILEVQ